MKKQIWKAIGGLSLAILALAIFAQVRVSAQDNGSAWLQTVNGANKPSLVGTWDVQVLIRDCQTGTVLFGFPAMITYNQDGTMQETDLGDPALVRLGGHGVWERQNGKQFSAAFRFIEFLPNRTFVKRNVVRSAITLGEGGSSYTSTDTVGFFDANGNPIGSLCATTTATRFE
jgi:hypothetical protein